MLKIFSLIVVWIFAPSLIFLAVGSQLIYASQQARHQRLTTRAQQLIQSHTQLTSSTLLSDTFVRS